MLLALVLVSFLCWASLYWMFCHISPLRSPEWNCRLVTAVHGLLSFSVSSWSAFVEGPFPISPDVVGRESLQLHVAAMVICLGYFLFDFSWCLIMQTEGLLMLAHHLTCIVGLCLSLSWGMSGAEVIATIVGSEITNPFLQLRWFLKQTDSYNSIIGTVTDIAFVFLFITVRIGVGAWLFVTAVPSPRVYLSFKVGGITLYVISLVFLVQILSFARHKLFGKQRMKEKLESSSDERELKSNGLAHTNGGHSHLKAS